MKMIAGFELNGRNPRHAPTIGAVISATTYSPFRIMTISSDSEQIAETPHASPSSPSIRFIALVSSSRSTGP